jgi:endogenous inhibitor of DNA gyrase (YacG/DUF329 family)
MSGPGRNVGATGKGNGVQETMKIKCEDCQKDAVIIENKKYYCDCYNIILLGCANKDYDLNPWTTVLNQVIKAK